MSPDPRSRYTGWARTDWEHVADTLLLAPRPYATPGHALIHLPGPASASGRWSDGLEGFARTFLLAAFRLAGADGADPHGLAQWYADGIRAGVDPSSPERWPRLTECRQAVVEAASVAIGLHETRPWVWDRLPARTREQVVDWLGDMVGLGTYENNWVWFQNVVEAFLRSVGGPWDPADIDSNLQAHESWYVGGGWYTDGGTHNYDYYAHWAMHLYPLWYCRMLGEQADASMRETYRDRLRQFLLDARELVASDGAPVFQGRSLTYRFAMLAPFWVGAVFDATPLPPGQTRRLTSGVLKYFAERGAPDADGLLPIGWHGAFVNVRQPYSGPGSPYWASKGFAGLLLPAEHPVWTEDEVPLPVEQADSVRVMHEPGWVVSSTVADGVVRVLNHGSDKRAGPAASVDLPFYARHGYATHSAPELSQADAQRPVDSHVALLDAEGVPSHRTPLTPVGIGSAGLASRSRAHWLDLSDRGGNTGGWESIRVGPWLTTASVVRGPLEVRLARVDPVDPGFGVPGTADNDDPDAWRLVDAGPWRLHIGGWSVATDTGAPGERSAGTTASVAVDSGLTSAVVAVSGVDEVGVQHRDGTNPLGRLSAAPWARTTTPVSFGQVYAAVVVLTGVPGVVDEARRVGMVADGDAVTVRWPSGDVDNLVLPAPTH